MHTKFLATALIVSVSYQAHADFINDASVTFNARNFYFSRDFRHSQAAQSKREEWAQGFILKAQSGYTPGTIGFGLDLHAALGIKLDSSDARAGTGLLPNSYGEVLRPFRGAENRGAENQAVENRDKVWWFHSSIAGAAIERCPATTTAVQWADSAQ